MRKDNNDANDIQVAHIGVKGIIIGGVIGVIGGLIGAIIGAAASVYIAQKQISLGHRTVRAEHLSKELDKLETIDRKLNELDSYYKDDPKEVEMQNAQLFQQVFRTVGPLSQLLSRDSWEDLKDAAAELDRCLWDAQSDTHVLPKRWPSISRRIKDATLKALRDIEALKRTKQEEIERLTSL